MPAKTATPTRKRTVKRTAKPKTTAKKQAKQPKASEVAKLRRAGKTWAEVREATGSRFNSTRFGKLLNEAGYDRKGAKA